MKKLFVTGVTGFLGSHFAKTVFESFDDISVYALVRAKNDQDGVARLKKAVDSAADYCNEELQVNNTTYPVLGNIKEKECGISEESFIALNDANIDAFWHFASTLNFEESRREHIEAANIGGVKHAIEAAEKMGAKQFVYVSTAYTSGAVQGQIKEELHHNIDYHNYYEETKSRAEHTVIEECKNKGISCAILRPSIVIGPLSTKSTGGSTTGFYGFIRGLYKARKKLKMLRSPVRIYGDPDVKLNLIPVDCLMQDILYLMETGMQDQSIHHLTIDDGPSIGDYVSTITEMLGIPNLSIELYDQSKTSFVEKMVQEQGVFYGSYINSHKTFERTIPHKWTLTPSDVKAFAQACIEESEQSKAVA